MRKALIRGQRIEHDNGAVHLGRRPECAGRQGEGHARPGDGLREDSETAIGGRSGCGADALADLLLEHQRHFTAPVPRLQPVYEEDRADIVGQVRDDHHRAIGAGFSERALPVHLAGIFLDDEEPAFARFRPVRQRAGKTGIGLNRNQLRCALIEDRPRQPAGAGANLDHGASGNGSGGGGGAVQDIGVKQEMLPEGFSGGCLGKWRGLVHTMAPWRCKAIWRAWRMAAIRLSARQVPAAAAS